MKLTHSCIITENVKKLSDFYKEVLQIEPNTFLAISKLGI